jgi:hypothetical protein
MTTAPSIISMRIKENLVFSLKKNVNKNISQQSKKLQKSALK